jgi:UPF0755 protein
MRKFTVTLLKYLIIALIPTGVAIGALMWLKVLIFTPPVSQIPAGSVFEIHADESFRTVAIRMEEQGLIRSQRALQIFGRIKEIDKKIRAGEYEIDGPLSIAQALKLLADGKIIERKVTIPEGSTIVQIAEAIERAGINQKDTLLEEFHRQKYLDILDIPAQSLEGYLFPETYHFAKSTPPEVIVNQMVKEGVTRWLQEYTDRAEELGLNRHETLTLASIIEKESGNLEEQPVISSVFHNRLKAKMKLQSDPTAIYGLENFNGNLTKEDLSNPHPYNTYVIAGLPPAPICNPGITAIKATLYPADTKYMYFVSTNKGSHVFSESYEEHLKMVELYQKNQD